MDSLKVLDPDGPIREADWIPVADPTMRLTETDLLPIDKREPPSYRGKSSIRTIAAQIA